MTKQTATHFLSDTPGIAICGRFAANVIRGAGTDDIPSIPSVRSNSKAKHSDTATRQLIPGVMVEDPRAVTCRQCVKLLPEWEGIVREHGGPNTESHGDDGH